MIIITSLALLVSYHSISFRHIQSNPACMCSLKFEVLSTSIQLNLTNEYLTGHQFFWTVSFWVFFTVSYLTLTRIYWCVIEQGFSLLVVMFPKSQRFSISWIYFFILNLNQIKWVPLVSSFNFQVHLSLLVPSLWPRRQPFQREFQKCSMWWWCGGFSSRLQKQHTLRILNSCLLIFFLVFHEKFWFGFSSMVL